MNLQESQSPTDALFIIGLSYPVLSLSAALLAEQYALRDLHIVGTTQGLPGLKKLARHAELPPCRKIHWHGDEVDGVDGDLSQTHFRQILQRVLCAGRDAVPMQIVLGGGVNWMIAIAAQFAALTLKETCGDGLWVLKTAPRLENHPHFLKPGDRAVLLDPDNGVTAAPENSARLQRVILLDHTRPAPAEKLRFDEQTLFFLGVAIRLPPLQLAFYRWLLKQTKLACRRPQLATCEACYACALPAKHLPALAEDFYRYYQDATAKPGYVKENNALDFPQRAAEIISKINANLRKQTNLALFRQLKVYHGEGGYLPGVDKNHL